MTLLELKEFLDEKSNLYENPNFINDDPIQIPHLFRQKEDIEISGFITSVLTWGKRSTTISKSKEQVIKEYYEAPKGVVADTPVKRMAIPTPIPQNKVVETKVINPVKEPQPIEGIKQAKKIDIFKPKTVETKTPETKSGIDAALDGIE